MGKQGGQHFTARLDAQKFGGLTHGSRLMRKYGLFKKVSQAKLKMPNLWGLSNANIT